MAKDEVKILLPGEDVTLSTGEKVTVSPVPFGKLGAFTSAVASLFIKLQAQKIDITDLSNLNGLLKVATEETMAIMGLVLGKDRQWFDRITIADGAALLNLIVKQNISDDSKKNIIELAGTISTLFQTASSTSSGAGTVSTASKATQ